MTKWVYVFGDGAAEGRAGDRNLLGGKGANLAEMCSLGLPVPPGFTITTEVCNAYYANGRAFPAELEGGGRSARSATSPALTGRNFGDPEKLLLVSVRSGARASMPGMMDTVLNLGLNDETVEALAADSGDARFAYDSYRRFIQMYSDVVLGLDHEIFEEILEDEKARLGHELDTEFSADRVAAMSIGLYKAEGRGRARQAFSAGPARAALGRDRRGLFELDEHARHHLPPPARHSRKAGARRSTCRPWCSAIWARPRPPALPSPAIPRPARRLLYGEFLVNAQGEDVVAGIRTPQNITETARIDAGSDKPSLQKLMPEAFAAFVGICDRLEKHYRDMQDLEFTIERGKLWMLQTRSGKRTAKAAIRDRRRDGERKG